MFKNCYRPGCHFDMNCRHNHRHGHWEKDCECNKKFYGEFNCCFPIEINFNRKEREDCCNKYEQENFGRQQYGYEQEYYQDENYNFENQPNQGFGNQEYNFYDFREENRFNNGCQKKYCHEKDWEREDCNRKENYQCHNHRNNCRCCLGFLAGCLFGCRKK